MNLKHNFIFSTITFILLIIGSSCGDKMEACDVCGPPESGYYFYAVIDGKEEIVTGTNGLGAGSCSDYTTNGGAWIKDPINNFNVWAASVYLNKEFPRSPSTSELYDMLEVGTYPFGSCGLEENGAELTWRDENDVFWHSEGDQTGSSFMITERGPQEGIETKIKGTFNCKLYNADGDSKIVESGSFRILVGLF